MSGQKNPEAQSTALDDLVAILDLETNSSAICFAVSSPRTGWQRVFGGQVIGQALGGSLSHGGGAPAAFPARLFPSARRAGHPDHLRGRPHARRALLTTRRVTAIQNGQPIFTMAASFQIDEPGFDHAAAMPDVPMPETLAGTGGFAPEVLAPDARNRASLFRARAPDRSASRRIRSL